MKVFGLDIRKAAPTGSTTVADNRGGWFRFGDYFPGSWQRDMEITPDQAIAHHAVFACVTLIAQDVGKLRIKLVEQDKNDIWQETTSPAFSPVLARPNGFQNHIQFKEWWITSKLLRGNTYALKQRDARKIVVALYLLDPSRVQVLVAPNGDVYYQLQTDNLSGLEKTIVVPASEIIHDRVNCLFHPLVGVSPIYASGMAANVGLKIQANSTNFFEHGSNPSGILSAPGVIDQATAERLAEAWNLNFSGDNAGKVAVLGSDLKFTPMRMNNVDSQTLEQLKWSAETVCSTFHVPPFKIGIGTMPTYNNGELLNQIYYADCLQSHIESFEAVMDEGLGLNEKKDGRVLGVELDLKALLRMDTATQVKALADGVKGGIYTPNEARKEMDLSPLTGGDTVYLQQQEFSMSALAKRDASDDPFKSATPTALPAPKDPPETENRELSRLALKFISGLRVAA